MPSGQLVCRLLLGNDPAGKGERTNNMAFEANSAEAGGDLKTIPGIGENIKRHLYRIGIKTIDGLKGQDPEGLYLKDCLAEGTQTDRCLLYVFRLAVYYAENNPRDPEKLKWQYWKDKEYKPLFRVSK